MKLPGVLLAACGLAGLLLLRRPVNYSLADKVVVITGGSRGLGLALAREFSRHGAKVALLARDREELERAATDLRNSGAEVTTWTCDVQRDQDVEETISAIGREYGRIDILVNNAGIMLVAPLDLMVKEDFEEAMNVHFWAAYRVIMAALPLTQAKSSKPHREYFFDRRACGRPAHGALLREQVCGGGVFRCDSGGARARRRAGDLGFSRTHADGLAYQRRVQGKSRQGIRLVLDQCRLAVPLHRRLTRCAPNRRGRAKWPPELTITLQARALILAQALAPGLFARAFNSSMPCFLEIPGVRPPAVVRAIIASRTCLPLG